MAKIAITQERNGIKSGASPRNSEKTAAINWAEVEKLAYQFFVERGYEHGHHDEDWVRAESIVRNRKKQ